MNIEKIKKHSLFLIVFGQETSLRFKITQAGWIYTLEVWKEARLLPWKLTRRNARMRINKSIMEIPVDMLLFFAHGNYYERNVSYWLEKILLGTKNRVLFDIGANYGYYCLKLADSARQIYAFEPVSRTYDILLKNVLNNNLTNITTYKLGFWDKKSSMEINIYNSSGNNSLFVKDSRDRSVGNRIGQEAISLVTLDELFQNEGLRPPDLIKVDIEGSELYALKGAREIIKKYQPVLVIEYEEREFNNAAYSRGDLLKELNAHNYIIYGLSEDRNNLKVYPLDEFDNIEIANIIALPKSMENLLLSPT